MLSYSFRRVRLYCPAGALQTFPYPLRSVGYPLPFLLWLLPLQGPGRFHVTRLIPPLCQLVVIDTGRGDPKESSTDALRAVHFYLDGRRNPRSLSPKSKVTGTEHPCIPKKSKKNFFGGGETSSMCSRTKAEERILPFSWQKQPIHINLPLN